MITHESQSVAGEQRAMGGTGLAGRVRRRPERASRPTCSLERLEALDAELVRRAREAGRLRFELGVGLELLERTGGDHALGFSSIEAYALERCERSASWSQKARALARRLEALPVLANALISGSIGWSMATVLAAVAGPDDADFWLAEAKRRTVREMKELVRQRRTGSGAGGDATGGLEHLEGEEPMRTLTITVPREDAWCFEQVKLLSRHLGERTGAEVMFGLVAEATSTLCGELPRSAIDVADSGAGTAQRAWEQELARMRAEAEVRCEANFARRAEELPDAKRVLWPQEPEAIDRQLRELAQELVTRDVDCGRALEVFFSAEGWRRLGFATAAQYARE